MQIEALQLYKTVTVLPLSDNMNKDASANANDIQTK